VATAFVGALFDGGAVVLEESQHGLVFAGNDGPEGFEAAPTGDVDERFEEEAAHSRTTKAISAEWPSSSR
jgi:hypothetical protein